ncbi:MAG: TetR/AcrR family transcriptional regulator C-terminal domain-containing protein [Pseudomonadota bacterium]
MTRSETQRPAIGRPAQIDQDQIVMASLRLGIDKLSMHAVAKSLGVSPTALYRHVENKEALINLCMDVFCERLTVPETTEWRSYLEQLGLNFYAALRAMPGAAGYGMRLGPSTPAAYRIVDRSMNVLRRNGWSPADAWFAYSAVVNLTFDSVRRREQYDALLAESNGEAPYAILKLNDETLSAFPDLSWSFSAPMHDLESLLERALACMLDGLSMRIAGATHV